MNYPPYPNNPNDPHSQSTIASQYPQFPQPGQPQWGQQAPPPPPQYPQQPGQYSQSGQNFPQYPQQYPQQGQSGPPPYPPAQPPMQPPPIKPYSDGVLCILLLLCIIAIPCGFFSGGVGNFGKSAFTSVLVSFLIMDWKGFTSIDGWVKWNQFSGAKKFWLSCLFIMLLPIAFIVYLARRANAFSEERKRQMPELPYRKGRPALAMVIGFFVFIFALAANAAPAPDTTTTTTVAPTPTQQVTHAAPTAKPKVTPTPKPTTTPTPTPEPTKAPVQQQPVQQAPVQQQAPPPAQLFVTITSAYATDYSSGSVSVHTLPGAALTISVQYCTGSYATTSKLQGTRYADSSGDYTWMWEPETKCKGAATAYVNASLNGQSASNSTTFTVS